MQIWIMEATVAKARGVSRIALLLGVSLQTLVRPQDFFRPGETRIFLVILPFDDLVGSGEDRQRHGEAKCPAGRAARFER
ncbi:MAG TPA: hypothetical protein VEC14_10750 [Reyranellaceae bacterium]|nr:hypothetical protein [Reyranellaceae bacterium]